MALLQSNVMAGSVGPDSISNIPRRSPLAELPIANFPPRPPSPVKMHSSPSKLSMSASSSSKSISSGKGSSSPHASRRGSSSTGKSPSPSSSSASRDKRRLPASMSMPSPIRASSFMLAGDASSIASRGKLLFASCRGDETVVGANSTCDADATLLQQAQASPSSHAWENKAISAKSRRLSKDSPAASDIGDASPFMSARTSSSPAVERPVPKSLGRKKERVRVGEVAQALLDQDEDLGHIRAGSPSPAVMRTHRMDVLQGSTSSASASASMTAAMASPSMLQAAPASIGLGISSLDVAQAHANGKQAPASWTVLADEPIAHLLERTAASSTASVTDEPLSTSASPSTLTPSLSSLTLLDDDKENRRPDRVVLQATRKKKGTGGRLSLVADAAGEEQSAAPAHAPTLATTMTTTSMPLSSSPR